MICDQLAPLDGLNECVMEFSCDASAFRQPFVEAGANRSRDLLHAPLVEGPHYRQSCGGAKGAEPSGLKPSRSDTEIQGRAFFVPDAVIVARNYSKSIRS